MIRININQSGRSINGYPPCYMVGIENIAYLGDTDNFAEAFDIANKAVKNYPNMGLFIQYNPWKG